MNFIDNYVNFAGEITDAPHSFHELFGYGIIASVMGNRVWMNVGAQRILPNLYAVAVGDSTTARKSTSLHIAKNLAIEAGAVFGANEITPEAFISDLADRPQQTILFNEFGAFLSKLNSREYLSPLRGLLTDLFDAPASYVRRTMKAEFHIQNPALTILAATTTAWLLDAIKIDDIQGGFLPRFIFSISGARGQPMPLPPPQDLAKRAALISHLQRLTALGGPASLSPEATGVYCEWFARFEQQKIPIILTAFRGRYQTLALKLSLLETLADSPSLLVTGAAMQRATARIDAVFEQLLAWNLDGIAFDRDTQDANKIVSCINSGISEHAAIMRETRIPKARIDRAVASLLESERVVCDEMPRTDRRGGRPRRIYRVLVEA